MDIRIKIQRIGLLSLILWGLPSVAGAMPDTFVPEDENQIIIEVAPGDPASVRALREDRERLLAQPDNLPLALDVAQRAIEEGRRRDDPRYFGYAEAALGPWWESSAPPADVRVLRATIFQYRHRFGAALQDLDGVLEANPGHGQARLTRAVINTVQARYDEALQDCAWLSRRGHSVAASGCAATPASLSGNAERAFELLGEVPLQSTDEQMRVWILTLRAEIAERLGRDDTESHYRIALDAMGEQPDRYLLNAYADWRLAQGDAEHVLERLSPYASSDGSLLRLALARQQLLQQEPDDSSLRRQLQADLEELEGRFRAEQDRGAAVHEREAAIFQLHLAENVDRALWLARDNFRNQREPLDARILLEAALAADAPAQAAPAVDWMRRNDVQDVRLAPLVSAVEQAVDGTEGADR